MSVEKLIMMNIVGKNNYVDKVLKEILLFENVQVVDAYNEIENFRFSLNVTDQNIDEIIGFSEAESGLKMANAEEFVHQLELLKKIFGDTYQIDKEILRKDINVEKVIEKVNIIYKETHSKYKTLKKYYKKIEEIEKSLRAYRYLSNANMEMEKINDLSNFNYTLGSFSKKNVNRLKNNYSNITAIVVHVGSLEEDEVYMVIWPQDLEIETHRILKSLNFNRIEGLNQEYKKKPQEIINRLRAEKVSLKEHAASLEKELSAIKDKYMEDSNYAYNVLHLFYKIQELKKDMAFSREHFYFSGWIPNRLKDQIQSLLGGFKDINILFYDENKSPNLSPPTKLKNNWMFKPFEAFIKMYGIPSYNEVDPTPFLSLSYLLLFGFMFGDVGQGFVFVLAGLIGRLKNINLSDILLRLGISSMIFGFLYGSVFGFETIIPSLWLKPFENINTLLIVAIAIGVILICIGYIYGMVNKMKSKDYLNVLFDKNGITGLILYLSLILVILTFTGNRILSVALLGILIITSIVLLFFKDFILGFLSKKPSKHKFNVEFFVEGFFEIFEVLLSIFSNTLSFIRVGAFALNHVGLFIAFESLAHMINNHIGSVIIYIIGNIFIIGLEGLIVGIQVLRLEYYELFSKYFTGGGKEFNPTKL